MSRSSGKQVSSQPVDLKKRDETQPKTKKMRKNGGGIIAIIIAAISLISTIAETMSDSKEA